MSLEFAGGGATDRVGFGSGADLDNVDPMTHLIWINPDVAGGTDEVISKDEQGIHTVRFFAANNIDWDRGNSPRARRRTNDDPITAGIWNFIACVLDQAVGTTQAVYVGTLAAPAVESTYADETNNTPGDDSANNLTVGNRDAATECMDGRIAVYAFVARALTLAECIDWQFNPRVVPDTKIFVIFGYNGTGTQPDLSGNGNNGTVAGSPTVADHIPLRPPFGFDLINLAAVAAPPQVIAVGQATEADLAQVITVIQTKIIPVGQATETDLAQVITATLQKVIPVGQASEINLAQKMFFPVALADAGLVFIRILTTEVANVVPVEFVTVFEPGVVRVREAFGVLTPIQNVIPVRETLETPRVKVILA